MVDSSSNLRHKSSPLDGPRKFYKDSALFLHRCTKPDRRGKLNLIIKMTLSHINPKNEFPFRVPQGLASCLNWFRVDGVHWILCQTRPHSN